MSPLDAAALGLVVVAVACTVGLVALSRLRRRERGRYSGSDGGASRRKGP